MQEILGEEFQLYTEYHTDKTTIRDLLSHKTGVPDYFLALLAMFPPSETRTSLVR